VQLDQPGREQSVARQSFIYDPDGRPLRCEFGTVGGSIDSTMTWHYDGRGQFTAVMVSLADGRELRREESTTNFVGRKTKKVTFTSGQRVDLYPIEGSEIFYPAAGAAQQTTLCDAEGRPVEVEFADAGGAIVQRVVMHRNAQGRVVMEEARGPFPALLQGAAGRQRFKEMTDDDFRKMLELAEYAGGSIRTTYEYDTEGRLASRVNQHGRLGDMHTAYCYDEHDNVVEQLERNTDRQIDLDADGNPQTTPETTRIREMRFAYTYDVEGNWTERSTTHRFAEDAAFQPGGAEWRAIEYFGRA
jgi:YD repeat-containing protein